MTNIIGILEQKAQEENKKSEKAALQTISDYYYHQGRETAFLYAIEIVKRCINESVRT